jgi:hypothetical protein
MGRHDKNKADTTPATKHVSHDYDKTGGGKHRPAPDLTSGHVGGKSGRGAGKMDGWGGDRSRTD